MLDPRLLLALVLSTTLAAPTGAARETPVLPSTAPLAPSAPPTDRDADSQERAAAIEAAITEGRGTDALELAGLALEYAPDDPELLELAGRAAIAAEASDLALWYTLRARDLILATPEEDRPGAELLESLEARRAELDPRFADYNGALEAYAAQCFELGKSAARRKLWANAVEFFEACDGTSLEGDAQKQLTKIYKKDAAIDALIASGLDVEFDDPAQRKSRKWLEREDAKHADWEKRWEVDSPGGYTIESNAGYEYTHEIARAMDQVNAFLRDMYQHKVQGQRMRGCRILIHKTREEAAIVWDLGPSTGGFFSPNDNMIVTYDYRSVGQTMQDTMETLSHELSHQFLRDVTKNLVPAWINEGIACYFEGTRLLDNGKVISNLVPESRLRGVARSLRTLDSNPSRLLGDGVPKEQYLEDVITYFQPGSYSGAYYPWGWGLIFFFRNYENEAGERIYRPRFDEYVETFKSGGKRALKEEFVEAFVTRPGVEGVETFEDFFAHWRDWIFELEELHFGGDEVIDTLLARGEIQVANGYLENSLETYGKVLRKDPTQIVALWNLAEANRELGSDDVAMYYYRGVVEWANAQIGRPDDSDDRTAAEYRVPGIGKTPEELLEEAFEQMDAINDDLTAGLRAAADGLRASLLALAEQYASEDGLPRLGLATLAQAEELIGPSGPQLALDERIRSEGALDLRQRRRLQVDAELERWFQQGDFEADGQAIVAEVDGLAYATYAVTPPPEYRLELTVEVEGASGDTSVVGLFFGAGIGERRIVGWVSSINELVRITDGESGPELDGQIGPLNLGDGTPTQLALDVSAEGVTFFIDGEEVGRHKYSAEDVRGRIGLAVQNARVRFSDLRLIY